MVTTPLRERMRLAMCIRNMSARTEQIYINAVARFAKHFGSSPEHLGAAEIEAYLLYLRDVKKASWCWFNQTACALRFLYANVLERPDLVVRIVYGRYERHLPVVLSRCSRPFTGSRPSPRVLPTHNAKQTTWFG